MSRGKRDARIVFRQFILYLSALTSVAINIRSKPWGLVGDFNAVKNTIFWRGGASAFYGEASLNKNTK
jgi:hypothetical protein